MWAANPAALQTADRHLGQLCGIPALATPSASTPAPPPPNAGLAGLAKNLFDVTYTGWQSPRLFRLRWNPQQNKETAWQEFPDHRAPHRLARPPPGRTRL